MHKYSEEEKLFIVENVKGKTTYELTEMFNKKFDLNLKRTQIAPTIKRLGLKSGLNCEFKKGHSNWNKGTKGLLKPNKTSFKKGQKSHNWVPIGSERITKDGYIQIKIQEVKDGRFQKNWKGKHILIWEEHNGPLPKGHAIIFGDRNNRNFDINNLILVSRQQLFILNQNNLIQSDVDLTKTGIIIADLYKKIADGKLYSKKHKYTVKGECK
jgi:hypothetical protein